MKKRISSLPAALAAELALRKEQVARGKVLSTAMKLRDAIPAIKLKYARLCERINNSRVGSGAVPFAGTVNQQPNEEQKSKGEVLDAERVLRCRYCDQHFYASRKHRRFCSVRCSNLLRTKRLGESRQQKRKET